MERGRRRGCIVFEWFWASDRHRKFGIGHSAMTPTFTLARWRYTISPIFLIEGPQYWEHGESNIATTRVVDGIKLSI